MSKFIGDETPNPHAFIHWKGTNVCMDFHCECGAFCHFDGDFAHAVMCPHCGAMWEMPVFVFPRRIYPATDPHNAARTKMLEPDEYHCDGAGNPLPVTASGDGEPTP